MPKKPETLISELFLESAANRQSIIRVFNFEIPAGASHPGGSVFGVIKIDSTHPVYDRMVEAVLDSIEKFYQEEHGLDFSAEFEKSLQSINKTITEFITRESNPVDLDKLNMLVAAAQNQSLSFTSVGEIQTIYFQKQSGKGYRVFEMTKNIKSDPEKTGLGKIFENVMYGEISPGDVILIANPELFEAFPQEVLQPIITANKPAEAVATVRDKLMSENFKGGYTAIIIQCYEEPVLVGTGENRKDFQKSLEHLKATEEETTRYLVGGSGGNIFTKVFSSVSVIISGILPTKSPKYDEKIAPDPHELPRKAGKFFVWLGAVIRQAFFSAINFIKNSFVYIFDYKGGRGGVREKYKGDIQGATDKGVGWFNALGKMNKSVFVVILIVVLIFVWSVIYISYRKNKAESEKIYNDKVIEITNKKDEAESSIIYGDEDRAWELIDEALAMIAALPQDKKSEREVRDNLTAEVEDLKEDLRHIERPSDLVRLTELPRGDNGEALIFDYYLSGDGENYTILSSVKDIFAWRPSESAWQKVDWENESISQINATLKNDDLYLILDSRPGISEVNLNELSWKDRTIDAADSQKSFVDLAAWGSNIYILDTEAGQIFKHRSGSTGYGVGVPWITTPGVSLGDAASMAIDGNIWVLKPAEIYKFYTGGKQSWNLGKIDPPLEGATKIWTNEDIDYLFVMEPKNKRILVMDKNGNLQTQYLIEEAENLKDFYVDTTARKIRVLADNGVWEFGFEE